MDIEKILKDNKIDLFKKKVIIAVSGGPDSVCLLYNLNKIKKDYQMDLSVCHINYRLRGSDSNKDENFVADLCKKLKISFYLLKPLNLDFYSEDSLRKIRYDFFEEIKEKIKADFIAVAHNCDDQAETILMNFLRGASVKGLAGMKMRSGSLIRPLLKTSRKEILHFLEKEKIDYRIDLTNLELDFFRNKIRNGLIPLLEKEYNCNIKNTLLRSGEVFKNIDDFLESYTEITLDAMARISDKKIEIDYKMWILLPAALKFESIKLVCLKLAGNLKDLEFAHIKEVVDMLTNKIPFGEKMLLKNLSIQEKYEKIVVEIKSKTLKTRQG
ncbi:MAG: tRNA lysidine(34) synthetase TilS [bacterium]